MDVPLTNNTLQGNGFSTTLLGFKEMQGYIGVRDIYRMLIFIRDKFM
jgi:hypothetical protein